MSGGDDTQMAREEEEEDDRATHEPKLRDFVSSDKGLIYRPQLGLAESDPYTDDGKYERIVVESQFEVVGGACNWDHTNHSIYCRGINKDGVPREFIFALGESVGRINKQLRSEGFVIRQTKLNLTLLGIYCGLTQDTRYRLSYQMGWQGNDFMAYVLPDGTSFVRRDFKKTQGIGEVNKPVHCIWRGSKVHKYNVEGTLELWRELVASNCEGNPQFVDGIITALAAVWLKPMNAIPFMAHMFGKERTGKTTKSRVAGSVWGGSHDDPLGFLETWNVTGNALEQKCGMHCDGLYLPDEISLMRDGNGLFNAAFSIVAGVMKERMGAPKHNPNTWRVLGLSTGNVTFEEQLRILGKPMVPAQQARIMSIPADGGAGLGIFSDVKEFALRDDLNAEGKILEFGKMLSINTQRAYGTAIREFLDSTMIHFDVDRKFIGEQMEEFKRLHIPKGSSANVRTLAEGFALKYAVSQLPIVREITGWPEDEGPKSIVWVWELWIKSLAKGALSALDASIIQCRDYLKVHYEELRRMLNGVEVLVIERMQFDQYAMGGVPSLPVLHWLEANRFLLHDKGRLTKKIEVVKGEGPVNRYVILAKFLES